MALIKLNNQSLTAVSALPASVGGKVLQVVNATTSTSTAITSTTFADTNLTASITPSSTSSKILVITSSVVDARSSNTQSGAGIQLVRDTTSLFNDPNGDGFFINAATSSGFSILVGRLPVNYLDSPSTTNAVTYKIQGRVTVSGDTATFQNNSNVSMITLMEIAQ